MSTTTTTTDIAHLSLEDFFKLRDTIRDAYETCEAAEQAACKIEDVTVDEFYAIREAAQNEFASHLGFVKSPLSRGAYRRYDLTFDGIRIGWVCKNEFDSGWFTIAAPYEGQQGRRVCTAATRKESAYNALNSLAIHRDLGI